MKILHTSDWHVGKTLRGASRLDEHRAVLAEIADDRGGRARRPRARHRRPVRVGRAAADAQRVVWDALLALRATGAHVVAIGGNHDNQYALDAWSPGVRRRRHHAARPRDRARSSVASSSSPRTRGERASRRAPAVRVAALRDPHRADARARRGRGRGPVRRTDAAADRRAEREASAPTRSTSSPRTASCGAARSAAASATRRRSSTTASRGCTFPTHANYIALGHLHRTQRMAAPAPAWYAGSPIQVDFGEEQDVKHVLLVEAEAGVPARVTTRRAHDSVDACGPSRGTLAELAAAGAAKPATRGCASSYARPTRAGLADDVRALFPRAVDVRDRDRRARRRRSRAHVAPRPVAARAVRRVPRERRGRGSAGSSGSSTGSTTTRSPRRRSDAPDRAARRRVRRLP